MVTYTPVSIAWEGDINLDQFSVSITPESFVLPRELQQQKEEIWEEVKLFDPQAYDGTITVATLSYAPLHLDLQPISYSNFQTLRLLANDYTRSFFQDHGAFCAVYLIFNSSRSHILVGIRKPKGEWGDNRFSCPGGILQFSLSSSNSPSSFFLGELQEEVGISLPFGLFKISGILESRNHRFTNVIITTTLTDDIAIDQSIPSNGEFVDKQLYWKPVTELVELDDDQLFGDLRFLKYSKQGF